MRIRCCFKCQKRKLACHDTCNEFKIEKDKLHKEKEHNRQYLKELSYTMTPYKQIGVPYK